MPSLHGRVGEVVTVFVDEDLVSGADPGDGVGERDGRGVLTLTGRILFIDAAHKATLDVNGRMVTFDVDDASE
jgi:hypothetical protein